MKTKVISVRDYAIIKKMAQIVAPLTAKKESIMKKVKAMLEEVEGEGGLNDQIKGMEIGIRAKFFGLGTEDLISKSTVPYIREDGTRALDSKTGKQLYKTIWEPKPCLVFNAEANNYILTIEDSDEETTSSEEHVEEAAKNVAVTIEDDVAPAEDLAQRDEAMEAFYSDDADNAENDNKENENTQVSNKISDDNPFGI